VSEKPSYKLSESDKAFQAEVDALVRRWAGDDPKEYWRRWKQLGSWSINKTQGDAVKKAALKAKLMADTGGRCMDCSKQYSAPMLQMHRLNQDHAHDRSKNFGYFLENVALVCADCHELREAPRR
jgi:hypothetical protein